MSSFKPSVRLTFETVGADRHRLLKFLQQQKNQLIEIDLDQVQHCDSAGLALLIEAKRLCKHYKKQFTITNMPKAIDALAAFCGVDVILYADLG